MLEGDAFKLGNHIPLKLETDSGDVLELVTPPIIFTSVQKAVIFRNYLARHLKKSVAKTHYYKYKVDELLVCLELVPKSMSPARVS